MQAQCDRLASRKALLSMWLCFLNEPLSLMNEAYVYVFVRVLSRLPAECRVLLCLQPKTVSYSGMPLQQYVVYTRPTGVS